jgi:hypothetical protein
MDWAPTDVEAAFMIAPVVWHEKALDRIRRDTDERRFHPLLEAGLMGAREASVERLGTEGERKSRRSAPAKCRLNAQTGWHPTVALAGPSTLKPDYLR